MDQDLKNRVHHILKIMADNPVALAAFLLDKHGRLLVYAGQAASFHPHGKFGSLKDNEKVYENLFMMGIEENWILGLIFSNEVKVDVVRELAQSNIHRLSELLRPYL